MASLISTMLLLSCAGENAPAEGKLGPNVILIIVDDLRADHLGYTDHTRPTSPNIDALARCSLVFRNAYSASSWTRSAVASLLTSTYPTEHLITKERRQSLLAEELLTIQELLGTHGFQTAAFYSSPHFRYGLDRGFDHVFYEGPKSADILYDRTLEWLDANQQERFFLLVHNIDPHSPFYFHEDFAFSPQRSQYREIEPLFPDKVNNKKNMCRHRENVVRLEKEALTEMKANYDGEIAFTDFHIGRLLRYLEKKGLSKSTAVVLTSDHGEEFLDHGGYWHGCTLYNELLQVPLIFHLPGSGSGEYAEAVSTIDILPTLIDALGVPTPESYRFSGQSLLPLTRGEPWQERPIISATAFRGPLQLSLVSDGYKYIRFADGAPIGLYDQHNDPIEQHNLLSQQPERTARMESALAEILKRSESVNGTAGAQSELDTATKEDLRSLGYLDE
jgi:arylsulfatase A-like enzyme